MEKRHYKDFFVVPANYTANMTREAINVTPDTWLDFYPHVKYLEFLQTVFDEAKSVWLTGNYGTGKSNAALVTCKLFMDDISRVNKWFEDYHKVIPNGDNLKKRLMEEREKGVLVVYDYNASGLGPNEEFLVRLEKGILAVLNKGGYEVPAKANLDLVIERLKREGENFFKTRDSMLNEMKSLKSNIRSIDLLIAKLQEESVSSTGTPTHYLEDVQAVFHRDNIYLNIDVPTFRSWISAICNANNISRIIYVFDEFSDFIDANSGTLKTFEDVTEAPAVNRFYLIPVTHKELNAFYGENSPGAKKARDRFYFRNLQMPNDIAFRLAAHAMKPVEEEPLKTEWKDAKDSLWNSIVSVVDMFNDPETSAAYVARQSFYDILPIHPMAAFLLKFLAESARSNQRSIFEYLKGSADGHEFQEFVANGGPLIINRQFLTVDYLWKYFMEREDAGQSKEIVDIKLEYDRIKAREFMNYDDEQPEIRVLKTVMLFSLLSRLNPNGHDRLLPTVENVELSFRGDGVVIDVSLILKDLAENRHCFSIVNGNIDLYTTSVGNDELDKKKKELDSQFYDLLLTNMCKSELEKATKGSRTGFSGGRFDIRVSDVNHTTLTNITPATRDKYSNKINKDDGSICIWFVVAKDKQEQMHIQAKQEALIRNLCEHRIIMVSFPEITFCEKNTNLWKEYVALRAQYVLENNLSAREQIKLSYERIESDWTSTLKASNTKLDVRYYNADIGDIEVRKSSWNEFKSILRTYTKKNLNGCPDVITDQITAFNNKGLKAWALAGIQFSGTGQQGQLVKYLTSQGVSPDETWFNANQNHPFGQIRGLLQKKYDNTVCRGSNLSLRKVYIELKRAPYGLRYNCLSAFTLGFCMRWVLDKNCQWTNGQMNWPLDDKTLAEIIEATVSEKTDKEKFICRLSREDKAFSENAVCFFGLSKQEGLTPIEALRMISASVEKNSCNVPLWILSKYIRSEHAEDEKIAEILDDLCIALRISSKGNTEERSAATSKVGREIICDAEIIDSVRRYTKSDIYITAFDHYVDSTEPDLMELAKRIDDNSHAYCDIILKRSAVTAGWLWNESDISGEIDRVKNDYRVIEIARKFLKITGYSTIEYVLTSIKNKIASVGVPVRIVKDKYSLVARFLQILEEDGDSKSIYEALFDCSDVLEELYSDPEKILLISIIRERLGTIDISDEELFAILENMSELPQYKVSMDSESYIKLVREQIEVSVRNTLIKNINSEWKRVLGTNTIQEWAYQTSLPAWTIFGELDNAAEFVKVLASPKEYTKEALKRKYEQLQTILPKSIKQCQEIFCEKAIPRRYKDLNIDLASLIEYLQNSAYGSDPNNWPENPDIDEFVKKQYKLVYASDIIRRMQAEDAEALKTKFLELVKNDPYIGLRYLEQ